MIIEDAKRILEILKQIRVLDEAMADPTLTTPNEKGCSEGQ